MFNKVLKIFHDGIIILSGDKVIYENDFLHEIFNSDSISED